MYAKILKINNLKEENGILDKEIKRLQKISPLTKSGAEKRLAIPILQAKQKELKSEFDSLALQVEQWVKTFPENHKDDGKIIVSHYCNFNNNYRNLQKTINHFGLSIKASNFKQKIARIWLDEISRK